MTTPAGWYPDPSGAPGQRYWDGRQWTEHSAAAAPSAPAKAGMATSAKVAIGVTVMAVAGLAGLHAYGNSLDESKADRRTVAQSTAGVVGSEVRDGKFAFVVESVEAAKNWYGEPKPRGQWVIATVQVSNIGNEPQSFFVQNQKLIDIAGREYAADSMAALRMNEDDTMVLDLGPGFTISVKIPFDVPATSTPAALMLHDSAFSGGVKVDV